LLVTGLTNGTAVQFQVLATNAVGTSGASALSNAVTPTAPVVVAAPAAPTIGTPVRGNASATATWTPGSNGGSAITGYTVRVVRSSNNTQVGALRSAAAGATSLAITGLSNGTAYRFQVRATNAVGTSAYSALSSAVTPATTPGTPVIRTPARGAAGGAITATANWGSATTGGSPITSYIVTATPMSSASVAATASGAPIVKTVAGSARSATFTFTQTGLNIRFRVQAVNALGTSNLSARSSNVVPR
jgi:hypothetical protein